MFFDGFPALLRVAVISVTAYAGLLLILRLAGKRALAKLNAFGLVITVAFGSTLATVLLTKDVTLAEGLLAFAMLAVLQFAVARGTMESTLLNRLVRAQPTLLVEHGRYLEAEIRGERLVRAEVDAAIRNAGIGRIEDVAAVVLETDGSFSVLPKDADGRELTALRSVKR